MQMIANTLRNTLERESGGAAVPDVVEWMSEYQFIVGFFEAVKKTTHLLTEGDSREDGHCSATAEGELILTDEAKDVLRSNFHDAHWEYLENYLLG